MRRGAAVAAAILLAGSAALVLRPARPTAVAPAGESPPVARVAAGAAAHGVSPEPAGRRGRRPRSLAGTHADGGLTVDAHGGFRASPETRWLFDYSLTATGEEPTPRIRARIVARLERRLPPAAAAEAVALLDRYLAYRERARDLAAGGTATASPEERLEAVVRLRREVLGVADADALFAAEETRDRAALARRRALADPALSPEQRGRALADAAAALPESVRQADAAATLPLRLGAEEAALRSAGASDADVQRLRQDAVGPEAAARLAALDRERAEWQARLDGYRAARAAIDADPSRSAAERERQRSALLAARFTPTERLRVEALDTVAGR